MCLGRENSKPQVERGNENHAPNWTLLGRRRTAEKELQAKYRSYIESKKEPDIEVQTQVSNVKLPRFGAENVRAARSAVEYVVRYDVPGNDGDFVVEECIYSDLQCLQRVS